ncbi:MAG TPA: flagellar filament capping protein FliD [Terracidiphilus sp.]|jgi:flagellar hook-associated protein 2
MSSVSALDSLLSGNSSSTINLSQILEAALGASSEGIDVNAAVSAAVTAAEAPEQTWESQESTLQSQASALNQLQTAATNLDNDMLSLNNLVGPLSATTVTTSNSSLVTATAASGTATGDHLVEVSNLATTASWTSGTFASSSTALPAGSFTITTGSGSSATITTDGTESLSDVASQINGDKLGVSASVITDATGSRLAIVANTSGSAANFTVSTGSSGYGFTQPITGTNASLTVDGITISSASNTVTGIIPGLTLNLLSADPGVYVSLGVSADTAQAAAAINQFVSDYNTVIQAVNAQFTDSGSGEGVLATDPNLRNLQDDLQSALSYLNTPSSGTTTVSNLSSLGITTNSDGTLTVDTATLNDALSNNFSDVQNFFQGTALNGFANSLDQQLTNFISPSDGAFTVDLQSISTQESGLQTDITNFQTNVITPLQANLKSEYSQAEILLQQLPTELKQIDQELGFNGSS